MVTAGLGNDGIHPIDGGHVEVKAHQRRVEGVIGGLDDRSYRTGGQRMRYRIVGKTSAGEGKVAIRQRVDDFKGSAGVYRIRNNRTGPHREDRVFLIEVV